MDRRTLLLIVCAFAITRLAGVWLADHPVAYGRDVTGDVATYESKAEAIIDEGWAPYSNVPVEYPPGALPFLLAPEIGFDDISFRVKFIALMLAVDILGLIGLMRLAGRWGSPLGCWLWIALVPLLGPLVYLRLDLAPAVATIWALERASVGGSFGTGAWLGFGTIAKLYPVFFLLPGLSSTRRRALLMAGVVVLTIPVLALGGGLDDLYRTVFGYHATRSVQVESTWATGLLLAMRQGYESVIRLNFGAFHIEGGVASLVKTIGTVVSLAALASVIVLSLRRVGRGAARALAAACFTILVVSMATGLVLSPQFFVWIFALAAVTLADPATPMRLTALLLLPAAALTQWVFPFLYEPILELDALGLFVLSLRNLFLVTVAAIAVTKLYGMPRALVGGREEAASPAPATS